VRKLGGKAMHFKSWCKN